jgi:ABC-type glycerol-3-phosphate transport system substrate-binding protein
MAADASRWGETRRRLTWRTLAGAALPFVAVACAGGGGEAKAPPANQPASLVLHTDWVPPGVRGDITTQGLAEYASRYPNLKVAPEPLGAADTAEKLTALIAADSIGDVAPWTHHLVVYFAKRNFFTDLRPYLRTFKFSMDDVHFIPEIGYYESKLLAVPFQLNMFDWTYNKTLFEQMGVAPPADTWTVDQMLTAAKALTQAEKNVWGLDWNINTGSPNLWVTPIRTNGGTLLNPTFTKTTLNDPAAVETLQLLVDVINRHQVAPSRAAIMEKSLSFSFAKGNMAMAFGQGVGCTLIKQMGEAYRWGMGSGFEYYTPWRNAVQAEIFKGWDGQVSAKAAEAATAAGVKVG